MNVIIIIIIFPVQHSFMDPIRAVVASVFAIGGAIYGFGLLGVLGIPLGLYLGLWVGAIAAYVLAVGLVLSVVFLAWLILAPFFAAMTDGSTSTSIPRNSNPATFSCPGAYGPSFTVGEKFVVPYGDGPTTLYSEPNKEPPRGQVLEGAGGMIIAGPACVTGQQGNLVAWRVAADNGAVGWASEGYPSNAIKWIIPQP